MNKGKRKRSFIPNMVLEYLHNHGVNYINSLPNGLDITIDNIIEYCENERIRTGESQIDFNKLVRDAISIGYDERYFEVTEASEERNLVANDFVNAFYINS
ncbi:MAG: hypothetical protein LBR68_07740 [Lachnoclostridium sp.]|nr:hypothetical protein [Lachnoclostridium sp.]